MIIKNNTTILCSNSTKKQLETALPEIFFRNFRTTILNWQTLDILQNTRAKVCMILSAKATRGTGYFSSKTLMML